MSRSEIDLELIKDKYKEMYHKLLDESINEKTSGRNFQKILKAISGERSERSVPRLMQQKTMSFTSDYLDTQEYRQILQRIDSTSMASFSSEEIKSAYDFNTPTIQKKFLYETEQELECKMRVKETRETMLDEKTEIIPTLPIVQIKPFLEETCSVREKENKVEEIFFKKIIDDDDGLMKVCVYSHVYHKEINHMIVLNHVLKYDELNITNMTLMNSKVNTQNTKTEIIII